MDKASTSGERTPLVQPTYVFHSSLTRSYQKRLRNFQCAICASLLIMLSIALLITVTYNLSEDGADQSDDNTTETPVAPLPSLNLSSVSPELATLLKNDWPLKGQPPGPWTGPAPSAEAISTAAAHGTAALRTKRELERQRKPLETNTPAGRAQRASSTAQKVKPMADLAYAAEHATRALLHGSNVTHRSGGVGVGPSVNGSFPQPPYCAKETPPCPASRYRTLDGTCNNLAHPLRWGVSNTPFRRVLPPDYGDGISSPRQGVDGQTLPSARDVSVTVHRPSYPHDVSFTVMLAVWGQFVDHDITATAISKGENSSALSCCDPTQPFHPECFPVKLDVEDPYYQEYKLTCMEFVRSAPAPTCNFGPRQQLNQATAFIDASTVYGFSHDRADSLRAPGGLLEMMVIDGRELLPQSTDPNDGCNTAAMNAKGRYCFNSGDDRANENLHLTTMHLIWARQHNRLVRQMKQMNPSWSDEVLFQEARKILGAQMQHITYSEFLPAILGADVMFALNLSVSTDGQVNSYDAAVDPSVANHFSAAAFRFAHTLLPGLIHSVSLNTGSVSYIHLHEILFNPFQLYQAQGSKAAMQSAMFTPVHGVDPHVTNELSNHLFENPSVANVSSSAPSPRAPCGLDLVSLNIQRGRDHGLPPYAAWREHCGFARPQTFKQLQKIMNQVSFERITNIYTHVEDIDLYTGALAEEPRGRLLGATLTCLIADQFLRLKVADRFWYETDDPVAGFTLAQLTEIRKTTLAGVLCANEDLMELVQPRVMEEISASNPLVQCRELPQPQLVPWQDAGAN